MRTLWKIDLDQDASFGYHLSKKHRAKYGNVYYHDITLGGIPKKMLTNAHRSAPRMKDCDQMCIDWSKNGVDLHNTVHKDRQ